MTGQITFFSSSFSQILSHVFYYTACFSTVFSFAPDNLVSRDGFGSPVPRQFFFLSHFPKFCVMYFITLLVSALYSPSRPRIWPREAVSALPSRVSLLISAQTASGAYLQNSSRVPLRRSFIYLNRHTRSSGRSRVCRVTQLRTNGVHCREYAGTGAVNLK